MAVGGLKKKRRIQLIVGAFVLLAGASALIGYAMRDGINYFLSPSQIAEAPPGPREVFRIGGLVEVGSLVRGQGKTITFSVTDGGASVAVTYTGILPDLFKEGQGMIATGNFVNNTFQASEILAKHDENYMPKEVADALKKQGVFKPANGS
ncbi:MAG: cytochrome c maturation protein CcmE [Proteobacteria bacterium]|jgi:cytochrome c-type biogenesis protein CcmE|nr:cytochrome c maturation protein CcmE [Pseudomonadota bacterium]